MGYKSIIKTMPKPRPFIIEVKTDNAGTSSSNQFTIPTSGSGYSYTVRTSNGVTTGNTGNVTITWPTAGTYEIEIYGNFPRIFFNFTGDRFKMLKVKQWGTNKWASMSNAFVGCVNIDVTAIDTPDLLLCTSLFQTFGACSNLINANGSISNWNVSTIVSMTGVFSSCLLFNKPLNNWNTSNVVVMSGMFQFASSFNQNIGSWNVSKVTDFLAMFQGATQFNNGGSSDINNWSINTIGSVNMTSMFQSAINFNQPLGNWNVSNVTNLNQMFQGATTFNQDIGSWNVSNVNAFSYMFLGASSFNNGGSDSIKNWVIKTTGNIVMIGMFQQSAFNQPINTNGAAWDMQYVTRIDNMFASNPTFNQNIGGWDVSKVTFFNNMFSGASSFNNGGSDSIKNWVIKTSGPVGMDGMFQLALVFNQPINTNGAAWDTQRVTGMSAMFSGTNFFNQDISGWNTSNVANMNAMFNSATAFNQNIGAWNVSKVTNFDNMFINATQFNNGGSSDINNWSINTTSSVTMLSMFKGAIVFNQPIGNWNTSSVTNTSMMFQLATLFNQDIGNWNVSNVANMNAMFNSATAFNQNIGAWNVSKVTNFDNMFQGATQFNNGGSSDINNWSINTSGTVIMTGMFQNCPFNQPIGLWNTSNVTNMSTMFNAATSFNQDISTWNVSNVTTFNGMFSTASSFNRNLGAWQLRLTGTVLSSIFTSSGMSIVNYTDTIVGWANYVQANSGTPANVAMGSQFSRTFQNSRSGLPGFTTAADARTYLTSVTPGGAGWTISGDTIIA
jgi:surface protein